MPNLKKSAKQARDLFNSEYQGILCTHSIDVEGYPFGSVVPYCLGNNGQPVILISTIAQHTKNILSNTKVSLIATEGQADDSQTVGRITYLGDARQISDSDEDTMERYYTFFPQSRGYHKTHDFNFYTIDLVRARYIGGFGKIFWVEKEQFLKANPFSFEEEQSMVNHMNTDHPDALTHYCSLFDIPNEEQNQPVMVGIDSEGFHLSIGARIHRIQFEQEISEAIDVRQALVAMAKKDKLSV